MVKLIVKPRPGCHHTPIIVMEEGTIFHYGSDNEVCLRIYDGFVSLADPSRTWTGRSVLQSERGTIWSTSPTITIEP